MIAKTFAIDILASRICESGKLRCLGIAFSHAAAAPDPEAVVKREPFLHRNLSARCKAATIPKVGAICPCNRVGGG